VQCSCTGLQQRANANGTSKFFLQLGSNYKHMGTGGAERTSPRETGHQGWFNLHLLIAQARRPGDAASWPVKIIGYDFVVPNVPIFLLQRHMPADYFFFKRNFDTKAEAVRTSPKLPVVCPHRPPRGSMIPLKINIASNYTCGHHHAHRPTTSRALQANSLGPTAKIYSWIKCVLQAGEPGKFQGLRHSPMA